jgi:DNA-3-methyladenine glycosylase I
MDAGTVIRRRAKIAVINNAQAQRKDGRDIAELAWSFAPAVHHPPEAIGEGQTSSPESAAFAKELKSIGYKYVGPVSMYAAMETFGVVNDHIRGCFLAAP